MSLSDYQILVIGTDGSVRTIYDGAGLYELRYERLLNDIGACALTVPSVAGLTDIFTLDTFIEVQRTSPVTGLLQTEDTYLTRLTHRFRDGQEERFIAGGLSLNHLLARRVIDPDDDPAAAGGYSTKAGVADEVMRGYAREQCGDLASALRQFPNFSVGATLNVGTGIGRRLRYDNLLEAFQDMALSGEMDFIISRITGNTLRLTIEPIGTDKTKSHNYPFAPFVLFNPLRGNLENPSILVDRKEEGNYAYALGQGPGEFRIVSQLPGMGIGDSPYNRIEFTVDARTTERGDTATLLTSARQGLEEKKQKQEFSFDLQANTPGSTYRKDFDIGDLVSAQWDEQEIDIRIRGVDVNIDSSGENIRVKIETI